MNIYLDNHENDRTSTSPDLTEPTKPGQKKLKIPSCLFVVAAHVNPELRFHTRCSNTHFRKHPKGFGDLDEPLGLTHS